MSDFPKKFNNDLGNGSLFVGIGGLITGLVALAKARWETNLAAKKQEHEQGLAADQQEHQQDQTSAKQWKDEYDKFVDAYREQGSKLLTLTEENARLAERNRQLKTENERLRSEIERLKNG